MDPVIILLAATFLSLEEALESSFGTLIWSDLFPIMFLRSGQWLQNQYFLRFYFCW
jgi:hypothetical protein